MTNIVAFRRPDAPAHVPALLNPSFIPGEVIDLRPICEPEPVTLIGRNKKLRAQRRKAWHMGMSRVTYYRTALDLESAIASAQRKGLPEGSRHPKIDPNQRGEMLRLWRAALAEQLLLPASRMSDIEWKRVTVRKGDHRYTGLIDQDIARAIERDLQFLADHPVRKCG
jgi:hypothetical protein